MTVESDTGHQVVVGVDGSEESLAALRWAASYAEATGSTVRAVLAWHYPSAVGPAPVGVAPPEIHQETEDKMRAALDSSIAEAFADTSAERVQAVIRYGHPAEVLIEESENASLLVVGHRGVSKLHGMLLGSVSMHCVSGAHCPVTVIRE